MPLSAGDKLGPYEIRAPLGAGGMGEVYRANDTRLDRTVAIKVLLASLSSDPSLKQRLEREAKAVPSPHLHAVRRRPQGRHGFSRHGISGRRDPGTPSGKRPAATRADDSLRCADCQRPGQSTQAGHYPSRSEARERQSALRNGDREASLFRNQPGQLDCCDPHHRAPVHHATPALTPVTLERVVKKCLAKDPDDRWQSAADLASELQWMCTGSPTSQSAMDAGSRL